MTVTRAVWFPSLLALSLALACGECGPSLSDGGPDAGVEPGQDASAPEDAGGDPKHDAGRPDAGGTDAGVDGGPGTLPPFTYATDCQPMGDDGTPGPLALEEAFPGLDFDNPLFMTPGPGTGRLYVIEQGGMVWSFDPSDAAGTKQPFLDLTDVVNAGGERGLLGIAFHPDFEDNDAFFVSYTERVDDVLYSVIARYTALDATTADADSEEPLIRERQPYINHNGGMIAFGPDGYLYIGFGDGGDGGDPKENAEQTTELLGSLLRIDVDTVEPPRAYGIPADNPFAGDTSGNQPEILAWGLRNPWRWSFDRQTGDLWLADVGQNAWEEVNFVDADTVAAADGINFGWDVFEGLACYEPPEDEDDCSSVTGTHVPEIVYSHAEGESITGGYVYRGNAMPALRGKYFYADYVTRQVWMYDPATQTGADTPVLTAPGGVPSFAEDESGELYVLTYGGTIYRLVETAAGTPPTPKPTLSATGCFTDLATLTPASGVVPYDVNMPLWSDGAAKERWLVLPPGGKITFADTDKWQFPVGTIFIKHFAMDTTWGDPSTRVRLETRFILVEPTGVRGFTYRWRDDGSDADLLAGQESRSLSLTLESGATPVAYSWTFPGPGQCLQCHTTASTGVLGVETAQLHREHRYGDVEVNQLEAFGAFGLFTSPPGALDAQPAFPALDDESASAGERARAWLHANCAHCHLPGGPTGRSLDLRYTTPLDEMNACDVPPEGGSFGIEGARLIKPGDPDASLLYYRDNNASGRMPPLGTSLIDDEAEAVERAWIEGMAGCDE